MNKEELSLLIKEGEGLTIEFKEQYSSRIVQDFVAFSNSIGGIILLGVKDDGTINGIILDNSKKAEITTLARNCSPAVDITIEQIDNVAVLTIPEGGRKPYSCSHGYYKRLDAVTQKLSTDEIHGFYQDHPRISFEEQKNSDFLSNDLSLEKVNTFLKECKMDLVAGENNFINIVSSLNLMKGDKFLNAGILFFADKVENFILHSQMSLLCYKGEDKVDVFDRSDIRDDLLSQFNATVFFLQKHLNKSSSIEGVERKDEYEIPLEVLREAVANAIVHRDYSIAGTSTWIEIYSDRIEITNPGGLPPGLDRSNFGKLSVRRNERIADLFFRMKKVEKIGSGIQRIRSILRNKNLDPPDFEINTSFKVVFYRQIYNIKLSNNERKIIRLIQGDKKIATRQIASSIGISETAVSNNLLKLKDKGIIRRVGSPKGGHWEVV